MKITTPLLAVSLALNAALLAVVIAGASHDSAPVAPVERPATTAVAESAAPAAETWGGLAAGDRAAQRDHLRASGFPPAVVRAILSAQIREEFAARRKALDAAMGANTAYWKNSPPDPKLQAEYRALAKEEQKALRELLGPDVENGAAANLQRQFPNMSAEKIEQLVAIRERYDEQRSQLLGNSRGQLLPEENQKIAALEKAMHAEFATVLAPPELEDYDLRASNSANNLRYNLTNFNATEAEFRALFKLQSAFDEQWRFYGGPSTQDQMRVRSDAQKQLNDDIKAALGDARYADYQRATDYNYRQTSQLIARLELPPANADQIWDVQKDLQPRATAIMQDRGLAPETRTQQLAALQQEAVTKLTPLLGGARGFEAYKQYGGGWLQNLAPRTFPPPRP